MSDTIEKTCPKCKKNAVHDKLDYCKDCNSLRTIRKQHLFKIACLKFHGLECSETKALVILPNLTDKDLEQLEWNRSGFEAYQKREGKRLPISAFSFVDLGRSTSRVSSSTGSVPLTKKVTRMLSAKRLISTNTYYTKIGKGDTDMKKKCVHFLKNRCVHCGTTPTIEGGYSPFQFHHRAGPGHESKKLQIGDRSVKNFQKVMLELTKCDLICANCHSSHHFFEHNEERVQKITALGLEEEFGIFLYNKS